MQCSTWCRPTSRPTSGAVVTSAGARAYRALRMRKRKDLRVLRGKHDNVYLSEAAEGAFFDVVAELDAWLQQRRELGVGDERPLFCWASGAPVRVSELRDLVKDLMRSIGLDPLGKRRRAHLKHLRH